MPTISVLTIRFNQPLYPRQIPSFRQAIINVAEEYESVFLQHGIPIDIFTNEIIKDGKKITLDRYPLVQYKIIERCAALTGIQQGAEAVRLLGELIRNTAAQTAGIVHNNCYIIEKSFECRMTRVTKMYRMYHWLALNPDNEKRYRAMQKLSDRVLLLEEILTRQIKKMTDDCNWQLKKEVKVFLGQINHVERNHHKGKKYLAIDCTFGCNLLLPEEIGLGNGPAFGFGKILNLPVYKPKAALKQTKEYAAVL